MRRGSGAVALVVGAVAAAAVALTGCSARGEADPVEGQVLEAIEEPDGGLVADPLASVQRLAADGDLFGVIASETQETDDPDLRTGWALAAWVQDGRRCYGLSTVTQAGAQSSSGCDDRELGAQITRRFVGQDLTATVWEVGAEVPGVTVTFEDGSTETYPVTDVGGGHWVVVPRTDVARGEPAIAEETS